METRPGNILFFQHNVTIEILGGPAKISRIAFNPREWFWVGVGWASGHAGLVKGAEMRCGS